MTKYITTAAADFEDREGVITTRKAGVHVYGHPDDMVNGKMIVEFVDEVAAIPMNHLILVDSNA